MGQIQSNLLVATRNINNLSLCCPRSPKKCNVRSGGLLEDIPGKHPILAGDLKIGPARGLVVVKRRRQESRQRSHLDRNRCSVGCNIHRLNVIERRIPKFYGRRTELCQGCNCRIVGKGCLELLNSVGGRRKCRRRGERITPSTLALKVC